MDTIEKLVSISINNPDFGIISPMQLNGSGTKLDNSFSNYISHQNTPNFISDLFLNTLYSVYESEFVNAAAWLMTLACIKKVGGFDPIFPHYAEDNDYVIRCKYNELKLGITSYATIYHDRNDKETDSKSLFNINKTGNFIKLKYKNPYNPLPKKHFLIRKWFFNIASNLLTSFYQDVNLRIENKRIIITLKLIKAIRKQRQIEKTTKAPHL